MRSNIFRAIFGKSGAAASVLLLASGAVLADVQQVNLTAAPTSANLPDGSTVPMWGYSCGTVVTGSTATCAKLNPLATGWSPIVITVPSGQDLQVNLTNGLPTPVPTSLTIVGQLGGGLGNSATSTVSPTHAPQELTWPVQGDSSAGDPTNQPVPQGPRVQSFSTEVAAGTGPAALTWTQPRPGTYLLESGTHPSIQGPMGLYGMVVVTTAPAGGAAGTAYPAVTYNSEIPLLFSEIDPVQNSEVAAAVATSGFSETQVWSGQSDKCGNPASANYHTCYPPAVNYTPLYYMINGVAFDKSAAPSSLFTATAGTSGTPPLPVTTGITGNVLVRMVNAGLRMHVPSIVGAQTGTPTAVPGFGLIAEDGNPLPGVTRVQSAVFMAAGKTYDVMINVPAAGPALPIFDREGSLSANATARDAGMLAYISVNGAGLPAAPAIGGAVAKDDVYNTVIPTRPLVVSSPAQGVIANDINVNGVKVMTAPTKGTLALNANGTFTYVPGAGWTSPDSFVYQANGAAGPTAIVTLKEGVVEAASGINCAASAYTSTVATSLTIKPSGILAACTDAAGYPLTVDVASVTPDSGLTLSVDGGGGFTASVGAHTTQVSKNFTFTAKNSQGTSGAAATVTLTFPAPSNLAVAVVDGLDHATAVTDYRWIIEEDRTFYVDPNCTTNPVPAGCPTVTSQAAPAVFGTNFHTSYMPVVAQGCTGTISCETGQKLLGHDAVCDIGNGGCRTDAAQKVALDPSQVHLDPTKHYYISVLPGDAADGGHAMGGAQISPACALGTSATCTASFAPVTVLVNPMPLTPAKLSVFVFEDDHPMNGEHDASGGVDTLSPNEPGLGGFNITIFDLVGGTGDSAGQLMYDEFGQPLSNALAGTIDPATGRDACPISKNARVGVYTGDEDPAPSDGTVSPTGITGVIPVCPQYESGSTNANNRVLSPLGGQAVVANLPPGRYGIVATPGADRIVRGEEWLQTNTLDGGKDLESFLRAGEPSYFQEFGPASFHVSMGFANPALIRTQGTALCRTTSCTHTVTGIVTGVHMSRPSDERLYGSGSRDTFGYTQCYVSLGSVDGADISFAKCRDDGTFTLTNVPAGDWRVTIFDQWNDQIVDGITTPVHVAAANVDMGEIAVHAWKNNLTTRTCIDTNGDGICQDNEGGLPFVPTNVRYRDGSISNLNSTDLDGNAGFNEVFPLFNWYVVETDSNRFKNTGTHVVNDAGGPVDGSTGPYACGQSGFPACGTGGGYENMARTHEDFPLPAALRVPGSVYCADANCFGSSIASGPISGGSSGSGGSTGRIDAPWVTSYGWQSFAGQNQFLEFGKKPFAVGENGGIHGHVVYASTRPFDDPSLLLQLTWEPMVPHVTINLYQAGTAPDGTQSLTLVDHTMTSSWDDWAQGFRSDGNPNMNCPGQDSGDLFFYTLKNQPNYLDWYNAQHGGPAVTQVANNSQYKCYDGMHNWNQLQPAPYDGMYQFPSVTGLNPTTGKATGTNCTICVGDPDTTDPYRNGTPMLPAGKYVVEMIVPPGYELVKEEDKNILLGDTYEAPVTQQFPGFGNIFIMPDQASVAAYNANNSLIQSSDEGVQPRHEGDTGSVETFWPCVGAERVVPDYMSLFPQSGQNAPFAGATRRLCDRKLVTLEDQMTVLAKFYVFSSTHVAGHFTGIISDDFTSEFDPFSPHFGEKFSPANLPVSVKDWAGNEIGRVYSDGQGIYNGLNYSSFSVNPPDPSGYIPNMMVLCMNDRGSAVTADPLYQAAYSQFCYELPFMPGQTGYFDTPVIPTAAFAAEYNHPDCAYPDSTPAIREVDGDGVGPYVSAAGHTLTITALGDQTVTNYGFTGPGATTAPWNQKTITRHYGFGLTQGAGSVTIGGKTAAVTSWSDSSIVVTVPTGVANCPIQQQLQYGGSTAQCGELVIKANNGKTSIDAVTVTIGGKAPTRLASGKTIQSAIDAARPGDLIIVPPGTYHELVVMWKPVRLQGVGAASSIIDANAHPSGILNDWRLRVVCLFGLAPNGTPGDWNNSCGTNLFGSDVFGFVATKTNPQVDRLPLEATVGWDATLNGNLAEQLQEPSLMGAYEGAGITVLSKGVRFPNGSNPFASDTFPDNTSLLTSSTNSNNCGSNTASAHNPFPSSFQCNPSRIDGLSVTNSSQGGGGIFVHGWAHNLEIANNRVSNNQGTLAGGIVIGQGEHPDGYIAGDAAGIPAPGSCESSRISGTQLPYCFDLNVNVHHNAVTNNANEGDELFSATPSGAGGVAFCTGADYYKFNYNWVCGNLTTGDGAGVSHLGFAKNGDIEHNTILFNQATNPTTPSNGGGLLIMSAPDTDPTCPGEADADCSHAFGVVGDGIGPGLTINANLIMGNAAEAGSGGGIRFQGVNGSEVSTFNLLPLLWYEVNVTNNIIANNVSGWDGAGVSLVDSVKVNLINNTIVSNDSTASSGTLFGAFFAPEASAPTPCPRDAQGASIRCIPISAPQPSGVASVGHSAEFIAALPNTVVCASGHPNCKQVSNPILYNDVIWQNRAFNIVVTDPTSGTQQATVALVPSLNQTATGQCVTAGASYWDIGLRGDTGPANHSSGFTMDPKASVLTSIAGYPGGGSGFKANTASFSPGLAAQYCNGAKIPPEAGGNWYNVPPGTFESNVPVPVFNLTAGATVDEGNNWINVSWGPLSLVKPTSETNPTTETMIGDYSLAAGSPAIGYVTNATSSTTYSAAPSLDFFDNPRKTNNAVDVGAVEFATPAIAIAGVTPTSVTFTNTPTGATSTAQTLTVSNTGGATLTGITVVVTAPFSRAAAGGTCGATLAAGATCTINLVFSPTATGSVTGTATVTANVPVSGSPVGLSGTGVPAVIAATLTPTSWTVAQSRNCPGTGILGILACTLDPSQAFTLTNTGNVPLTGIGQGVLGGLANNVANYTIVRALSTCGPAGGGQLVANTTLAPGSTCVIRVQFKPLTAQATGAKPATVSVADLAGTQTSTLNGTAN